MANLVLPQNAFVFLRKNWFQVTLSLLVIYMLLSKDLSFSVNFQAPTNNGQTEKPQRKQVMTDATPPTASATEEKLNFLPTTNYSSASSLANIDDSKKAEYLKRFARVAVEERKKFNIPASVILASGLLQSKAGTEAFTQSGNNQFGTRCGDDWKKERMLQSGHCFRKYETAWFSFRDNSQLLNQGKFKNLSKYGARDYKNWAKGLEELRFSNEPNFSNQIIKIIEQYKLYELDK